MVAMQTRSLNTNRHRVRELNRRWFSRLHRFVLCAVAAMFVAWIRMVFWFIHVEDEGGPVPVVPVVPVPARVSNNGDRVLGGGLDEDRGSGSSYTARSGSSSSSGGGGGNDENNNKDNRNHHKDDDDDNNNNNNNNNGQSQSQSRNQNQRCSEPFSIARDLTEEQRNPTVGRRWMVRPPTGGTLHLMCCETTKGAFRVLLHERWAPIGVAHLLEMARGGYFEEEIPLFRCTDACQFGLSANRTLTKQFDDHRHNTKIRDDPLWLPTGPEHRFYSPPSSSNNNNNNNGIGIKRYPKGVLTHAGAGKNSRGVQFVLTLKPNMFMGGGSPWEVPLGEIVHASKGSNGIHIDDDPDLPVPDFYTGYGEKGPGQGLLHREGVTPAVREQWPLLDYVHRCSIVDRFVGK